MRIETLSSIREFMTGVGMLSILDAWFALVFIAFMLYYSLPLTGIVLLVIPLYLLQNLWSVPIVRHKLDAVWQYGAQNQSFLVESINNISTIKASHNAADKNIDIKFGVDDIQLPLHPGAEQFWKDNGYIK